MFRAALSRKPWVGLAAGIVLAGTPLSASKAADSLATPITGHRAEELWPIEVELEIVPLRVGPRPAPTSESTPLPHRSIVVPDGNRVSFSGSIWTPRGQQTFELSVVPRHHPDRVVELEWDLEVAEATYRELSVGRYLLHRLQLGPRPPLEDPILKIARSDIVSTRDERFERSVQIGEDLFEIRIFARSLRG